MEFIVLLLQLLFVSNSNVPIFPIQLDKLEMYQIYGYGNHYLEASDWHLIQSLKKPANTVVVWENLQKSSILSIEYSHFQEPTSINYYDDGFFNVILTYYQPAEKQASCHQNTIYLTEHIGTFNEESYLSRYWVDLSNELIPRQIHLIVPERERQAFNTYSARFFPMLSECPVESQVDSSLERERSSEELP